MVHPQNVKPNGKVDLFHKTDDGWVPVELWAVDATHALSVDAESYALEIPPPDELPPKPESQGEADGDTVTENEGEADERSEQQSSGPGMGPRPESAESPDQARPAGEFETGIGG